MLMIIAMGCLTLTDMLIKIASQTLPIGQVMITYGIGALVVFWGLLVIKGEPIQLSPLTNPVVIWRNVTKQQTHLPELRQQRIHIPVRMPQTVPPRPRHVPRQIKYHRARR